MFNLTINNTEYAFNFGFGFMREIDPKITKKIDGVSGKVQHMGLQYAVAGIIDKDVNDLVTVLVTANKGYEPRLTTGDIEKYIENSDTDIDALFEDVLGFLKKANCTKNTVANFEKAIAEQKEAAEKQTA